MTNFITEESLKRETAIQGNVESSLLIPYISLAQQIHIEPLLGIALTTEIKQQIDDDEISDENKILLSFISKALNFWTFYESIPLLSIKITNKGINYKTSDNSETVGEDAISFLRKEIRDKAQFFQNSLRNFLIENSTTYPLWREPECQPITKKIKYFGGIS